MENLVKLAQKAALSASHILLSRQGQFTIDTAIEKHKNDFVTSIDVDSEKSIRQILLGGFPGSTFLGEETEKNEASEFVWVVDPLDGTKNYLHKFPFFSVSIALITGREVKLGVIYEPLRKLMFHAIAGGGAYLNGEKISVFHPGDIRLSLIATGFPFKYREKINPYLEIFKEVFMNFSGIRRAGSAALDLAFTAGGSFSGFFEYGLSIWDIAAGCLLVKEAGGKVADFKGGKNYLQTGNVVAGDGQVVDTMLKIVQRHAIL